MGKEEASSCQQGVQEHSFEEFTNREFYKEINLQTVKYSLPAGQILDIATGTGGIVELLLQEGKLKPGGRIIGIDRDGSAISKARQNFSNTSPNIEFLQGDAEKLPVPDKSFDLVTLCNAIHLTDVPKTLFEVYRVLNNGGEFIANSAFVGGVGYPTPEAEQLWRSLGVGAMRKAMKQGHRPTRNTDFVNYSVDDYTRLACEAGFCGIETLTLEANMSHKDVLAICHYDEFARGVLPGVPLDVAHSVLEATTHEIFKNLGDNGVIPRNWMVLRAKK